MSNNSITSGLAAALSPELNTTPLLFTSWRWMAWVVANMVLNALTTYSPSVSASTSFLYKISFRNHGTYMTYGIIKTP